MPVLLISTYDLGRQPFGLALPAAWLRRAGVEVTCLDTSRDHVTDEQLAGASLVAFYLPMHTATRLAGPLIDRTRRVNPAAVLGAYGLYAPLNAGWLAERGIAHVLGPEAEADLVALATGSEPVGAHRGSLIAPDRTGLPPLIRYASLEMPDGERRVVGSTDATRGCKHVCRHCPIVPVYHGRFRAVPVEAVLADIRAQVIAGAQHISFGDPDFFNGPTHARRIVERFAAEWPRVTYDATIKIEHILNHADLLPLLRDTGCLFVTSAVESIDDKVLTLLRKGHTRADFLRAVALCRAVGLELSPTFLPFTPWTTLTGYVELLDLLDAQDLVAQVAPIQLAIRLLVTDRSPMRELEAVQQACGAYDAASLTWQWRHADPRVDLLQADVMALVGQHAQDPRGDVFDAIRALAASKTGGVQRPARERTARPVPHVSEPWYCCAEPDAQQCEPV